MNKIKRTLKQKIFDAINFFISQFESKYSMTKIEEQKLSEIMFPPPKEIIHLGETGHFEIKQRFPNFMTGFASEVFTFDTIDQLEKASFISRWMNNEKFYQLSISPSNMGQKTLMVELTDNSFWAIGYIKNLL